MSSYRVYDNILIKLEHVFLRVETEVDREIVALTMEHERLNAALSDLKRKIEVLNSLKRSYNLYGDEAIELHNLNRTLFRVLCDKQIQLRFLQEKEILISGYLLPVPQVQLPSVSQINKEYKLRKRLQEIELLASFLLEDRMFAALTQELERANELFDLALESGESASLESIIVLFSNYFEKIMNAYDLPQDLVDEFKAFEAQISLQANSVTMLNSQELASVTTLQQSFKKVHDDRINLELEIDKLLYQFNMFQNGKKIILAELRNVGGELESILFREYAVKQKIKELRQYKIELNDRKHNFMKDPTVDGYADAVAQLESVENRFRRLVMHKSFDKNTQFGHFLAVNKPQMRRQLNEEKSPYNKILFQIMHSSHISSLDKALILRLSKPSKLVNSRSGKLFFQRPSKSRSLKTLEQTFKKLALSELH